MDVQNGYYNSGTYAYYYSGSDVFYSCNYAINFVAWDDNFYPYKTAENGAFICRNSRGTGFGDKRYFYRNGITFSDALSLTAENVCVQYQGHVQSMGWQNYVSYGAY
ncbi:MAG: hypothetical protein LIR50_04930 [Bacillota bacterium]|nr:hypothetical protein [Bacillota bacterium]